MPASELIAKLLKDTRFYSDKSEEDRLAIATAIVETKDDASVVSSTLTDEILFQSSQRDQVTYNLVKASDGAYSLLTFKGACIARPEVNRNRDKISPKGITEIVSTIVGRAIDVEHRLQDICGMFTGSRVGVDGEALVDGVIFADRHPQVADDILSGKGKLSVEAKAETAKCSKCGEVFSMASDYCEHLTARARTADRELDGLQARGGGVTARPAGTGTVFDANRIYMLANHAEPEPDEADDAKETPEEEKKEDEAAKKKKKADEKDDMSMKDEKDMMKASWYDSYLKEGESVNDLPASDFADSAGRRFPYKIHGKVIESGWRAAYSAARGGHTGKEDKAAVAKLLRDKPKDITISEATTMEEIETLKAQITEMQAALDAKAAEFASLEAKNTELASQVKAFTDEANALKASARRQALNVTDEEWGKLAEPLMKLDDTAFTLMASKMKPDEKRPVSLTIPQPQGDKRVSLR